jgi:hypothetical protein
MAYLPYDGCWRTGGDRRLSLRHVVCQSFTFLYPRQGHDYGANTANSNHLIWLRKPRLFANIPERSGRHSRHCGRRNPDRARRGLDDAPDGGYVLARSGSEAPRNGSAPQALCRQARAAGDRSNVGPGTDETTGQSARARTDRLDASGLVSASGSSASNCYRRCCLEENCAWPVYSVQHTRPAVRPTHLLRHYTHLEA